MIVEMVRRHDRAPFIVKRVLRRSRARGPAPYRLLPISWAGTFHRAGQTSKVDAMTAIPGSLSRSRSTGATSTAEPRSKSSLTAPSAGVARHLAMLRKGEPRCSAGRPSSDRLSPESPVLPPNRVRYASLGVQKGRYTSVNRPFCGPWARGNTCKSSDSMVSNDIDFLKHFEVYVSASCRQRLL